MRDEQVADDRPRVLVAEDDADLRQYIVGVLGERYRTEAVAKGSAALASALTQTPDLILTAEMMPRLDGVGLLTALRADPRTSGVPVIMMTARANEDSRVEEMQQGADGYLEKPFSTRELLACVAAQQQMARMRREAHDALRASEAHHRVLFEHTADGIVLTDATGRYVDVNAAACKLLGYSREEVLARTTRDVLEPDEWSRIAPEIAQCADGRVMRSKWRFRRKDGSVFVGEITGSQLPDGRVQGILRDITEQRAVEAATRASEIQIRSILESITDGFFALDRDWRITYINTAGERFLHRTPGDLIGKSLWEAFPGTVGSEFERVYRRVAAKQMVESFTAYYPNFDRWYEVNAYPATEGLTVYFRDVTERRQIEQERQRFAALVDASPDFIGVAGLDQRGVYVNRAGMALSGLQPGQLANISVVDFFPESERDRILSVIADSEGGEQVVVDTNFQHLQTGQLIPVSWSFMRLRDTNGDVTGYATVTRDLTARKQHEESTHQTLVTIVERCPFGIYIVDDEFRIVSMNKGSQQSAFANVQPVIGRPFDEAMHLIWTEPVAADVIEIFRRTLATGDSYYSRNFVHARLDVDLTEAYEWELHRIDMPNGRYGAACYFFDSTRLREAEQKLTEADRQKDEFLAILAHELRNPLAPILNGLQLMRLTHGDADATERTRLMMERQLGQMVHLIDDLLDLSRISCGKIELRKQQIELASVIAQAIETSRPFIDQCGHELLVDVPPSPIHVDGDLTRLAQVFSNLLNNAAKYTQRGGRIRLTVQQFETEAVVSVKDDGIGIPTHMLSKIFEMFTQVDRNEERPQGGLGIGLSLVNQLVEMHGGSVEARSDGSGKGSEFVVCLPLDVSVVGHEPFDEANVVRPTARYRILVVDDNVDAAESLAMLLMIMGHETRTAHDGLEALDVAAEFRPEVILLDIGMPKLDGFDVCRRIRHQAWGKDMLVIALTGWGLHEDKRKTQAAGVDAHLVKPVAPAAVERLVAELSAARAR